MKTFCPECGLGVAVDDDGLCVTCGATATGAAVEDCVAEIIRELDCLYQTAKDRQKAFTGIASENYYRGQVVGYGKAIGLLMTKHRSKIQQAAPAGLNIGSQL